MCEVIHNGISRILFEQTVHRCVEAGLVSGKDAAIDASFVSADESWQHKMRDGDMDVPRLSRPVREWLADQANAPAQEQGVPRGTPAVLSRTDPATAWAARTAKGRFGYAFNVLIDTPDGVAVDVEASPARFAAEVDAGRIMLAQAGDWLGSFPNGSRPTPPMAAPPFSRSSTIMVRFRISRCWSLGTDQGQVPARSLPL